MKNIKLFIVASLVMIGTMVVASSFDYGSVKAEQTQTHSPDGVIALQVIDMIYIPVETSEVILPQPTEKAEPARKGYAMQVFHPPLSASYL